MSPSVLPVLSSESKRVKQEMLSALQAALPNDRVDLIERLSPQQLSEVRVAVAANPSTEMLSDLPRLLPRLHWVQSLWAGVENLLEAAALNNFQIARLIDPQLSDTMAEAALAWTLYLHRRMPEYRALQTKRSWQQLTWRTAAECRVSVLGLGKLGYASATRLQANGFDLTGWSATPKRLANINCLHGEQGLHEALAQADILLILLPLTPATHQLINRDTLALLPEKSALINFARGGIINSAHLLDALDNGDLSHAVLDVFDNEPLQAESPLWQHPQITVLPHIAAPTDPKSAITIAARNIRAFRESDTLPPTVDLARGF